MLLQPLCCSCYKFFYEAGPASSGRFGSYPNSSKKSFSYLRCSYRFQLHRHLCNRLEKSKVCRLLDAWHYATIGAPSSIFSAAVTLSSKSIPISWNKYCLSNTFSMVHLFLLDQYPNAPG